jgi:PEP-CTERM motif-containing protein
MMRWPAFEPALWCRAACLLAAVALHAPLQAQLVELASGGFVDRQTGLVWQAGRAGETWQQTFLTTGYRLASVAEVNTLFDHAGITSSIGSTSDPDDPRFGAVSGLIQLFGCILCDKTAGLDFWTLDEGPPGTHAMGSLFDGYDPSVNEYFWRAFCCFAASDDRFDPMAGGAVFVKIVPEPATWALLVMGVGALVARVRRPVRG